MLIRSMISPKRMDHPELAEELDKNERGVYRVQEVAIRLPSYRSCDVQVNNRRY